MVDEIDRRRFLARTAVTGAVGWTLTGSGVRADTAAADRIVVGVMGLNRGQHLATLFAKQPGVEVKYVCDADADRAGSCAQAVPNASGSPPRAVGDFRRILDDPDVDALVCAAPNHWHAPATILACKAGKHVYVEKPCCHNPREGDLMVAAARKYNRAVQMGTQRRSSPETIRAVEQLRAGVIGPLYLARSWYNATRPSIGKGKPAAVPAALDYDLWQGPAPRRPYIDNRIPYNWHWFWHWGNGELGNNGIHPLDLCRWALGVELPVHVTSSGGRYRFDDDQETPDTHMVAFDFEGKKSITWQGLSCNGHGHGHEFITFYGHEGAVELEMDGAYTIYDAKNNKVRTEPGSGTGEQQHIADFIAAIRDDRPLRLHAEIAEGCKSTLLSHLGNIAHRTGRALRCNPQTGEILNDAEAMALWAREYEPGWELSVA